MRFKRPVFNTAQTVFASQTAILGAFVFLLFGGLSASAQTPMAAMPAQQGTADSSDQNGQMADQIAELRVQVARLQAAVQQTGPGKKGTTKSGMKMTAPALGMGEMGVAPKGGMSMKEGEGEMGGMSPGGSAPMSPGMSMGDGPMGGMPMGAQSGASPSPAMGMCCGKKSSGGNAGMSADASNASEMASTNGSSSAMPGQAGASHIYHIGSNGFFLNHSQHITLTQDQRLALNRLKEKAMLDNAYQQRRIDQDEQELYSLTGADQPDDTKIQGKISAIEKLRADERMNFIRSVEEASNVLSPEQRKVLLGTMTSSKK